MPSWDPAQYQRFTAERARPFHDLVARITTPDPGSVVDLGCGPGNTTAVLADRWPDAEVLGLDSSAAMIAAAGAHARPGRLRFAVGSVVDWDARPVDVVVSNAVLQWVPDHLELLPRWAAALRPGGALAIQLPRSDAMPAGRIFQAVATSAPWRHRLGAAAGAAGPRSAASPVRPLGEYVDVLAGTGLRVDAWETTYHHILAGDDPVLDWFTGTGLRPYLDALADDPPARDAFRAEVADRLRKEYPRAGYGTVLPFPRLFAVAHHT